MYLILSSTSGRLFFRIRRVTNYKRQGTYTVALDVPTASPLIDLSQLEIRSSVEDEFPENLEGRWCVYRKGAPEYHEGGKRVSECESQES